MGIKEILAAKKAAEAAAAAAEQSTETVTVRVDKETAAAVQANPEGAVKALEQAVAEQTKEVSMIAATLEETAKPAEPQKPLTFAEKMALRKAQVQAAQKQPPKEKPALVIDPSELPSDPADAQAFVDIKTRIHNLEDLMDDDLRNAMSELKQALKKNPNASELLLDSDVGKMVTSLRRMAHVAVVAAKEPKKPGRKTTPKAKDVQLTPEEVNAAFDEL